RAAWRSSEGRVASAPAAAAPASMSRRCIICLRIIWIPVEQLRARQIQSPWDGGPCHSAGSKGLWHDTENDRSRLRMRYYPGAVVASVAIWLLATPGSAFSQEQGMTPPKDTIFARKILMGAINTNMDEIETMLSPGETLKLAEGQEHADTISIML